MRRLYPKIGLALAAFLVSLLVAESVVRWWLPQNLSGSFTVVTSTGLVVNKSEGVTRHQFGERILHYRFHEPGLRDTPLPPAGIKVLVLGDSYTFGFLLEYEDSYVGLLQRMADEHFGKGTFVFLNAAVPGWGTGAELAYLEDFGPQVEPDIVLVFVNSGDIGRSMDRRMYQPVLGKIAELQRTDLPYSVIKRFLNSVPGYQWLLEHSHLFQLARNRFAMSELRPHELRAERLIAGPGAKRPDLLPGVAIIYGRVLFTRLNRWCSLNGASLWVTTTGWFDASDTSNEVPTLAFIREAGTFFRKLGVPFRDLAPWVYAVKEADPEGHIIRREGHPNELGAKLIADAAFYHFVKEQLGAFCAAGDRC